MRKKELEAIWGVITQADVKARRDVASVRTNDPNAQVELATAATMGAIVDRLERYRLADDFDNWGFDSEYCEDKDNAEMHIDMCCGNIWAAFRCGYIQALKDRRD